MFHSHISQEIHRVELSLFIHNVISNIMTAHEDFRTLSIAQKLLGLCIGKIECQTDWPFPVLTNGFKHLQSRRKERKVQKKASSLVDLGKPFCLGVDFQKSYIFLGTIQEEFAAPLFFDSSSQLVSYLRINPVSSKCYILHLHRDSLKKRGRKPQLNMACVKTLGNQSLRNNYCSTMSILSRREKIINFQGFMSPPRTGKETNAAVLCNC